MFQFQLYFVAVRTEKRSRLRDGSPGSGVGVKLSLKCGILHQSDQLTTQQMLIIPSFAVQLPCWCCLTLLTMYNATCVLICTDINLVIQAHCWLIICNSMQQNYTELHSNMINSKSQTLFSFFEWSDMLIIKTMSCIYCVMWISY